MPEPTSTPTAMATIDMSALRKSPSPAASSAPMICATPCRPKAPGTNSQKVGRNVTGTGGRSCGSEWRSTPEARRLPR